MNGGDHDHFVGRIPFHRLGGVVALYRNGLFLEGVAPLTRYSSRHVHRLGKGDGERRLDYSRQMESVSIFPWLTIKTNRSICPISS